MGRVSGGFVDHAGRRFRWVRAGGVDGDMFEAARVFGELVDGAGEMRFRRRRMCGFVWSSVTVVGPPRMWWPRLAFGSRSVTFGFGLRLVVVGWQRAGRSGCDAAVGLDDGMDADVRDGGDR